MASIGRIKPGQALYTLTRQRMGNTTIIKVAVHDVVVREVDPARRFVIAFWDGNPGKKFRSMEVTKWRVNRPAKP